MVTLTGCVAICPPRVLCDTRIHAHRKSDRALGVSMPPLGQSCAPWQHLPLPDLWCLQGSGSVVVRLPPRSVGRKRQRWSGLVGQFGLRLLGGAVRHCPRCGGPAGLRRGAEEVEICLRHTLPTEADRDRSPTCRAGTSRSPSTRSL
jgi:hypothetical protein